MNFQKSFLILKPGIESNANVNANEEDLESLCNNFRVNRLNDAIVT